MKPFDIDLARRGYSVITRDGQRVRILRSDVNNEYPIVALVDRGYSEYAEMFTIDGYANISSDKENDNDLFIDDSEQIICELNGYRYLLGPEAPEKMTWYDAKDWCKSIGYDLPTREVLAMAFMNEIISRQFKADHYWSLTEESANAYTQNFMFMAVVSKTQLLDVRAVRKEFI